MKKNLLLGICTFLSFIKLSAQPILYGVASSGGKYGYGTLFSFNVSNNILDVKNNFDNDAEGGNPIGKLLLASNGKFYGTTNGGGDSLGFGVLFEFDPVTNVFSKKINFDGPTTGGNNYSSLIEYPTGKLIGTCSSGGGYGYGTIFQYDIASNTITKLHDFDYYSGSTPYFGVTLASNGKLYGESYQGGFDGYGNFYEFDLQTSVFTEIHSFNSESGNPWNSVREYNGNMYGVTYTGGTNDNGTIFEYNLNDSTFTTKANFELPVNGANPYAGISLASNGLFYGSNISGGGNGNGNLFSFDPNTNIVKRLYDFNYDDDGRPANPVTQSSDGNLYGMTDHGKNDNGSIFRFDIASSTYMIIKKLDSITGTNPYLSELTEWIPNDQVCESFKVDAGKDEIVYLGYAPSACAKLNASINGGLPPYNYLWSNGATTSSINICPHNTTSYTLTTTDSSGCSASDIVTVCVIDVRAEIGWKNPFFKPKNYVMICHTWSNGKKSTLIVNSSEVPNFLNHGDKLGKCSSSTSCMQNNGTIKSETEVVKNDDELNVEKRNSVSIYPNPNAGLFNLIINANQSGTINISVMSVTGQPLLELVKQNPTGAVQLPIDLTEYSNGIYFLKIQMKEEVIIKKIIVDK